MSDFDGVIAPGPQWPSVPQLSTEALVLGGAGGPSNAQAQALAARIEYLRVMLELVSGPVGMSVIGGAL